MNQSKDNLDFNIDFNRGDIVLQNGDGTKSIYHEDKLEREQRELTNELYKKIATLSKNRADIKNQINSYIQSLEIYEMCLIAHFMTSYNETIRENKLAHTALVLITERLQRHLKINDPYQKPSKFNSKINWDLARNQIKCDEVAERFNIKLIGSGDIRQGLCPFHEERTPSFTIYLKDNTYHCFSCKAHGNSIDLLNHLNSK